jgi:PKD repeat protein
MNFDLNTILFLSGLIVVAWIARDYIIVGISDLLSLSGKYKKTYISLLILVCLVVGVTANANVSYNVTNSTPFSDIVRYSNGTYGFLWQYTNATRPNSAFNFTTDFYLSTTTDGNAFSNVSLGIQGWYGAVKQTSAASCVDLNDVVHIITSPLDESYSVVGEPSQYYQQSASGLSAPVSLDFPFNRSYIEGLVCHPDGNITGLSHYYDFETAKHIAFTFTRTPSGNWYNNTLIVGYTGMAGIDSHCNRTYILMANSTNNTVMLFNESTPGTWNKAVFYASGDYRADDLVVNQSSPCDNPHILGSMVSWEATARYRTFVGGTAGSPGALTTINSSVALTPPRLSFDGSNYWIWYKYYSSSIYRDSYAIMGGSNSTIFGMTSVDLNGTAGSTGYIGEIDVFKHPDSASAAIYNEFYSDSPSGSRIFRMAWYNIAGFNFTVSDTPTLPTSAFTANTTSGCAPLSVQFTDQSTGSPTSWCWNVSGYGDGVRCDYTTQNPTHTYSSVGTYTVNLTVTNAEGSDSEVKSSYITVSTSPVSSFTQNSTGGVAILLVQFNDTSTGSPTAWAWWAVPQSNSTWTLLGTNQNQVGIFGDADEYQIYLNASNGCGFDLSDPSWVNVTDSCVAPTAAFSGTPTSGDATLTVDFTDSSTGTPPFTYAWDFENDGVVDSSDQNPSHDYTIAGTYTVNLTVGNGCGTDSEVKANYITVNPPTTTTVPPTTTPTPPGNETDTNVTMLNTTVWQSPSLNNIPVPIWIAMIVLGVVFFFGGITFRSFSPLGEMILSAGAMAFFAASAFAAPMVGEVSYYVVNGELTAVFTGWQGDWSSLLLWGMALISLLMIFDGVLLAFTEAARYDEDNEWDRQLGL